MHSRNFYNVVIFAAFLACFSENALAQVVWSTGVQEVWDSNVYLENGKATPIPEGAPEDYKLPDYADGKKNDDFLTNVHISASGAIPLSTDLETAMDARVGGIFFANNTSEDKFTIDSTFSTKSRETLIPAPYSLSFSNTITSGQRDLGTAGGSASRTTAANDASLTFSDDGHEIADNTKLPWSVGLSRHDFLGELLFKSRDKVVNEDGEEVETYKARGSDYFSTNVNFGVTHDYSQQTKFAFNNNVNYMLFTSAESNSENVSNSDLNRINYTPTLSISHTPNDKMGTSASVGLNASFYTDPKERTLADGTIEKSDSSALSLFWSGNVSYAVAERTSLVASAMQSAGTDIDGRRTLSRTFSLAASHSPAERVSASLSGLYTQFTRDKDSLADYTERWEAIASLNFKIMETVSLTVGYNYTVQNDPSDEVSHVSLYDTSSYGDYKGSRAYISLDTGFVGLM